MKSSVGKPLSSLPDETETTVLTLARSFRVFLISLAGLGALGWLTAMIVPAVSAGGGSASLFIPGARPGLAPEPRERAVYVLLCLLAPFVVAGAYAFDRKRLRIFDAHAKLLVAAGAALSVAAAALVFYSSDFGRSFFMIRGLRAWPATAVAACFMAWHLGSKKQHAEIWPARMIWFCAAVFGLLVSVSFRVFDYYMISPTPEFCVPFNAVLHSAAQMMNGAKLLVDVPAMYGLYPLYFKPVFYFTGFSVLAFTSVMAALQVFCMALFAFLMTRWSEDALIRSLFFLGMTYLMGTWYLIMHSWDPYYQYLPIRLLCPVLLTCLLDWELRHPGRRNLLAVSYVAGLGALWNLDSGIVVCVAWLALLLLRNAYRLWQPARLRSFAQCAWGTAGISAGLATAYICLSALNGAWLPAGRLFHYQAAFYGAGFNMLPMPLTPHPWMAVACVYLGALIYGLRGCHKPQPQAPSSREQFVLFLAILGTGLFSYYQGRSHDFCLPAAAWPAWLILLVAAGRLKTLTSARIAPKTVLLPLALVMFAAISWSLNLVANTDRYAAIAAACYRQWRDRRPTQFTRAVEAIRARASASGEKELLILSKLQASYYAETGLHSPFRGPSFNELLFTADADELAAVFLRETAQREIALDSTFFTWGNGFSIWGEAAKQLPPLSITGRTEDSLGLVFLKQHTP